MRSSSTNSLLNGCYVCFKYSVVISCRARRELGGGKRLKEITKKNNPPTLLLDVLIYQEALYKPELVLRTQLISLLTPLTCEQPGALQTKGLSCSKFIFDSS